MENSHRRVEGLSTPLLPPGYTRCSSTAATNSSEEDAVSLCEDDCSEAMSECQQDWLFLTDLVDSTPDLPPLPANCSNMLEVECVSINAGDDTVMEDCLPDSSTDTRTTLIIIVICLCLGIPILLCAVLLVATTLCYCRSSEPPRGD
ncbi:hypothetical protein GBAR_LOCUS21296, partial [Geodia barretti]